MTNRYDVRRDRILIVDVEATCWDGPPPKGERSEIVEFGLAEVDVASLELTRRASLLVRPVRSTISPFCTELTGIRQADVRSRGRPLREVAATLRKEWGVGAKAWMSWGTDREAIERDMVAADVPSPFSTHFTDLGFLFGAMLGSRSAIGLGTALELVGIERTGRAHSGMEDAATTARLWIETARLARATIPLDRIAADRPS